MLKFGGKDVADLRLGTRQVDAAYLGSILVWPAGTTIRGSLLATSALSGEVQVWREIVGGLAAASALAGSAGVERQVSGSLASVSGAAADAIVSSDKLVRGMMVALSVLSGAVSVSRALAGAAQALSSASSVAEVNRSISGAAIAVSQMVAAIKMHRGASGTISAVSAMAGEADVETPSAGISISSWLKGQKTAGSAASTVSFASLSPSAGDYLLYLVASDGFASGQSSLDMIPSGYTDAFASPNTNPSGAVAYKKLGPGEDSVNLPAVPGQGNDHVYMMALLKGVHPTTPMDATPTSASGGSGDPDCPPITTVTAGALVVAVGLIDDDTITSVTAYPSGYTNTDFNGGNDASVCVACKIVDTPGVENPSAYNTSADDAWWAVTLALRPA